MDAPVRADVVIGFAGSMSGRHATAGNEMRASAEAAVASANSANSGETIRLLIADDGCNTDGAQAAARQLVEGSAKIVIGHACANAAVAAAPVYATAGVILISTTRHGLLTDRRAGPGIFRLAGRDDQQGQEAARYVIHAHKGSPVAIVHDRTAYARGLADGFRSVLSAQGHALVADEGIVASEKDYSGVAARIKAGGARLVYFAGFPAEAAIVHSELRATGSTALLVGSDSLATPDFAEHAGQNAEGVLVLVSTAAERDTAARMTGAAIEVATRVLRSKDPSSTNLAAELAAATFATTIGPVSFDAKGDASIAAFAVYRWRNGTLVRSQ